MRSRGCFRTSQGRGDVLIRLPLNNAHEGGNGLLTRKTMNGCDDFGVLFRVDRIF